MKPIIFKQPGTQYWYTLYRGRNGKLRFTVSASWHWATIDALAYVDIAQSKGDCE